MGHSPTRGPPGPEVLKVSRVGSGRVRRCPESHGSHREVFKSHRIARVGLVTLARPDPRGLTRSVARPVKSRGVFGRLKWVQQGSAKKQNKKILSTLFFGEEPDMGGNHQNQVNNSRKKKHLLIGSHRKHCAPVSFLFDLSEYRSVFVSSCVPLV